MQLNGDGAKVLEVFTKEHGSVYLEAWNIRLHQNAMNRDEEVLPTTITKEVQ